MTSSNEFNSSEFIFIYLETTSPVPVMLDSAGRKSHATDCDVTDIIHIFLTLKILSRKVFENHLYAYAVVAVQDDFSVLSDCFHN